MTKAEEIRHEQELAEQARPVVLEGLRDGAELLTLAERVAERFDIDARKAYRWVTFINEEHERRRSRIGVAGLALLWPGLITLVGGPLLWLLGVSAGPLALWIVGLAIGLPLTIAGTAVLAARPTGTGR